MGLGVWIPVVIAILGAFMVLRFMPAHHLDAVEEPGAEVAPSDVAQQS